MSGIAALELFFAKLTAEIMPKITLRQAS